MSAFSKFFVLIHICNFCYKPEAVESSISDYGRKQLFLKLSSTIKVELLN